MTKAKSLWPDPGLDLVLGQFRPGLGPSLPLPYSEEQVFVVWTGSDHRVHYLPSLVYTYTVYTYTYLYLWCKRACRDEYKASL